MISNLLLRIIADADGIIQKLAGNLRVLNLLVAYA
jgi:hypothetical protein